MKPLLFLILMISFCSCGSGESKAVQDAKKTQDVLKEMEPGGNATSNNGWQMTAKLNGKDWAASYLLSPGATDRIMGKNSEGSISLPYDRRYLVAGKKIKISHENAVDLTTDDEVALWGGYEGEMEITKVDNNWAEGRFFFTATANNTEKKVEVTDGFFRISLGNK